MKRIVSIILMVLVLTMAFTSCEIVNDILGKETTTSNNQQTTGTEEGNGENSVNKTGVWANATYLSNKDFGNGSKTVQVEVKAEGKSITFTLHTDKATLGEALIEHNLISGEQGAYGLYVKFVNGIEADHDKDQSYWAFYQNGEYMMSGVDTTSISGGEHYELSKEK